MSVLTADEKAALSHTTTAIGRTGAQELEIGFLDDEPPHRWYAADRLLAAHDRDQVEAERLLEKAGERGL